MRVELQVSLKVSEIAVVRFLQEKEALLTEPIEMYDSEKAASAIECSAHKDN